MPLRSSIRALAEWCYKLLYHFNDRHDDRNMLIMAINPWYALRCNAEGHYDECRGAVFIYSIWHFNSRCYEIPTYYLKNIQKIRNVPNLVNFIVVLILKKLAFTRLWAKFKIILLSKHRRYSVSGETIQCFRDKMRRIVTDQRF